MRSRLRENNKVLHYLRALLRASEVCILLGDKRSVSVDSRSTVLGAIPEEQVVGRLLMRVWTLGKITFLSSCCCEEGIPQEEIHAL